MSFPPEPAPYEARILRVLDHIHSHPGSDLSLDALADLAAMSRFHWHRVFRAVTGETPADAVRRIRMGRAAWWLIGTDWPIRKVARACGYPALPSFSRIFTEATGLTPAAYRNRGALVPLALPRNQGSDLMLPVEIRDLPATRLAALDHLGAYPAIGLAFEKAGAILSARNLMDQAQGMIAVFYDDPATVPEPALRSRAGIIVADSFAIPDPFVDMTIAAGPYAVMTYKGPYAGLPAAYDFLYGEWLPESGAEPGDRPVFERYLNTPMDTAQDDLLTEVCLPLKSVAH